MKLPDALSSLTAQLVALGALCALLLFSQLGSLGIWEPWEAAEILTAMEYASRPAFDPAVVVDRPEAPGYNWAVPTLEGKPVASSLLQIWLVKALLPAQGEDIRELVGALERNARLPFALFGALLALSLFAWIRRHADALRAALASVALIGFPVLFVGAHNVATPLLFVATTSLALIAAFELVHAESSRRAWAMSALLTLSLLATALDQRLSGVLLVLSVVAASALIELPRSAAASRPKRATMIASFLTFCLPALLLLVALATSSYDQLLETLSKPYAGRLMMLLTALTSIAAALIAARKTRTVQALLSPQGLIPLLLTAALLALIGHAYGEVNPTLLKRGELLDEIPSLAFLLGDTPYGQSLAKQHFRLDLWIRQIGFATFPWAALIPAALAHLARSMQSPDDQLDARSPRPDGATLEALHRYLLTWAFVALFFMAAASTQDHYFYPAYAPLAAACGLLLGDVGFWLESRRLKPIRPYLVGMSAVAIVLMLGKDLERYPHRFIELFAQMPKELALPENFSWGKSYKPLKYVMLVVLILGFFKPLSWALLQLEGAPALRERFKAWRAKESELFAPITPAELSPLEERALRRDALLRGETTSSSKLAAALAPVARLIERPASRAVLVASTFTLFALATLFSYIPEATNHLSQRHIFETFITSSEPGQKLYGYQTPKNDTSLYLRDINALASSRELLAAMGDGQERLFAIVPRDKLAQVNMTVRQQLKRNVNVLNADSSKLVLISDRLDPGQPDYNFIAERILDPSEQLPEAIQHPVTFEDERGQQVHATFDGQLEFLGYSLDRLGDQKGPGVPAYDWGEGIELSLFFRVKKRVPASQQFFVHLDTAGNRLHGDHYPLSGDFPTNTWLPGDIVRDTHTIPVESYSKPGNYSINFGFYIGDNRMKIEPKSAHRNDNRVTIGNIRVTR